MAAMIQSYDNFWEPFLPVMAHNFAPMIYTMELQKGKIGTIVKAAEAQVLQWLRGVSLTTTIEVAAPESSSHRPLRGILPEAGQAQFKQAQWHISTIYGTVTYENVPELLSRSPENRANIISEATYLTRRTIDMIYKDMNRRLWCNGDAALGYITDYTHQKWDATTSILYLADNTPENGGAGAVGGYVSGVTDAATAAAENRFCHFYGRLGMKVDVINGSTHLPRSDGGINSANGFEICYLSYSPKDDTPVVVGLRAPELTGTITLANGDYLVKHADISPLGVSYAPFGMTAFFAPYNPTSNGAIGGGATIAARNIGAVNAETDVMWRPQASLTPSSLTNLVEDLIDAFYLGSKFNEAGIDTCITTEPARMKLFQKLKEQVQFNDMLKMWYGYTAIEVALGENTLDIMVDPECPATNIFLFNRNDLQYAELEPLHIVGTADKVASGDVDVTTLRLRAVGQMLLTKRQGMVKVKGVISTLSDS